MNFLWFAQVVLGGHGFIVRPWPLIVDTYNNALEQGLLRAPKASARTKKSELLAPENYQVIINMISNIRWVILYTNMYFMVSTKIDKYNVG